MELIADGLLIATAMTAGLYCMVLSRRLRRLAESGNGIGPQIAALDQALEDTRAALAETRDGVSELRGSTKAVIAELTRETARGETVAEQIERGVEKAKAAMQRLYEAGDRIEAYENRPAEVILAVDGDPDGPADDPGGGAAGEDAPVIEAQVKAGENAPAGPAGDGADPAGEPGEDDGAIGSGPKVVLPEGRIVEPREAEGAAAVAPEAAGERTGSILKAERVVL